ncbi:B12-binding domain-containing radical SAM protein [Candidatus Latescibacterota bacterium]
MTQCNDIILVQPGAHRLQIGGAILHLPLQLLSLAAWLRRDSSLGDRIRILDMHIRTPDVGDFSTARIVGISAMTGQQIQHGLEAARLSRKANPDVIIVWGGVHATLLYEETARHPLVDVVVIGEGEETFREVIEAVFNGVNIDGIPGTCVQRDDGAIVTGPKRDFVDMNDIPLPAYDLLDMKNYRGIEYQFDYQSSRGCPFRCGFCYNTAFCGRKWRSKSSKKVIDELEHLYTTYRVKNFAPVDDEFFINRKRAEEIFRGILDRGLDSGVVASCRLDIVRKYTPESLKIMKKAGVMQMFFGAESGSDDTLSRIHKDITSEDIIEGARTVAEAGIRPILSFMSGFPGETFEQFGSTLDIIQHLWKINPLITINGIFPFNAYPGTELFRQAVELGLKPPDNLEDWGAWRFQYEPDNPWLDRKIKNWMQVSFYIVRFRYYLARLEDRHKNSIRVKLIKLIMLPMSVSAQVRMSRRWFRFAWEWRLFAFAVRKTFGYL